MPLRPDMKQSDYLDILRRRKWLILFSVLVILFGATVYCVLTPDQYRAVVKFRIIPPAVPEGMVRANLDISTDERLLIIRQDILGKHHLLELIEEIGISILGFNDMSPEGMVAAMRERTIVGSDPKKKTKDDSKNILDPNIFLLSFDHENPQVAEHVASRLASILVLKNVKSREAVTQGTTGFLASQLEETRKRLEQQEEKMKRYKLQFGGELPQQEASNLNRLSRLQDQIKSNSESIARLADRKVLLESKISAEEIPTGDGVSGNQGEKDPAEPLFAEHAVRRKKLEEINAKYTPLHPAAVQARIEMAQLEARIDNVRQMAKQGEELSGGSAADPSGKSSVTILQKGKPESKWVQPLREQISAIDLEIAALKRESVSASLTIDQIQIKMERLPQREQELISLTRDYENIKAAYDGLLKKQIEARVSENLLGKQKGEQIQILEPAELPVRPFKPERLKVLGLALLASLVIGVGGSIGIEILDPTLRGSRDFKSLFDMPILACLPVIQDDRTRHRVAVRRAAVVGGLVSILGAYAIFLTFHGERVLSLIGLFPGGKN